MQAEYGRRPTDHEIMLYLGINQECKGLLKSELLMELSALS